MSHAFRKRGFLPVVYKKRTGLVKSHWVAYVKLRHTYTCFLAGCLSSKEKLLR